MKNLPPPRLRAGGCADQYDRLRSAVLAPPTELMKLDAQIIASKLRLKDLETALKLDDEYRKERERDDVPEPRVRVQVREPRSEELTAAVEKAKNDEAERTLMQVSECHRKWKAIRERAKKIMGEPANIIDKNMKYGACAPGAIHTLTALTGKSLLRALDRLRQIVGDDESIHVVERAYMCQACGLAYGCYVMESEISDEQFARWEKIAERWED